MLVVYNPILWRCATKNYTTEPLIARKDILVTAFKTIQHVKEWGARYDPLSKDSSRPELRNVPTYDQPDPAGIWLDLLKKQNENILKKYKTTREFKLTVKETLPVGT